MSELKRLIGDLRKNKAGIRGILAIITIFLYGIIGSHFIMNLNINDSIYYTIITIATVGYGDIAPITPLQKLFSTTLALTGIGLIAYIFTVIITSFEKNLHDLRSGRYMEKRLAEMENHYVLCGFGRVGLSVFEELKKESPLLHIYRTIHDDRIVYYRLKIVPVEDGRKLIYGFENIDSQYRIQLEVKSEREMHTMLLDGLSREYMSVWYLDGKSRKVRLLQNNGTDSENGEPVRIGNTMVDYHFSMQKYFGAFVSPDDFDRMMNETSYESLVKNAGENDMYCINYIRINPDRSTSHFQVCYAKTIDASGTANFVFGFRNTDSAI